MRINGSPHVFSITVQPYLQGRRIAVRLERGGGATPHGGGVSRHGGVGK